MILNRQNLIPFLLQAGVIDLGAVVDGELRVEPSTHRNRTFRVRDGRGGGWFVKQHRGDEGRWTRRSTLEVEARVYHLAAAERRLDGVLPELVAFDSARQALVLRLIPGGRPLAERHAATGRLAPETAARLGRALADCHTALRAGAAELHLGREAPWILRAHELDPHASREQSAAQARVVALVQGAPELMEPLRELAGAWRGDAVLHGDAKFANVVVLPGADGGEEVRIVDWEMASVGDAAWDVGGMLQSWLADWVMSMHPAPGATPGQAAASAALPLDPMRPAMRAFVDGYLAERRLRGAPRRALVRRALRYAGARLAQTAFEQMDRRRRLSAQMVVILQLCANLMERPDQAARSLLEAA